MLKALKTLADKEAEIHFSRFSLLEALWVVIRLVRNFDVRWEDFRYGLKDVVRSRRYKSIEETPEIFNDALELYLMGHEDIIDNILYANSIHYNLKLLTLDRSLEEFVNSKGLKTLFLFPN